METKQAVYYNPADELDEELSVDFKKIAFMLRCRGLLIVKVISVVLAFFVLLTFILPKKYKVDADLYINKANNSNMAEINPYVIEELGAGGGMTALMSGGGTLTNELELIQSPLVIDKVIQENGLRYRKKWGIIPNPKEGEYISTKAFIGKGKNISFENKKGTNVITIEYKCKDPELAYNVVNSIIKNYVQLHKELNSEKSKSDIKIIEEEYNKAKTELGSKLNSINGVPETAMGSAGNISAMSAFSKSARDALSVLKGQVVSGIKSKAEVTEKSAKVAALSQRLEWAKLVDEMSDTSKVLVIKEPQKLRSFEYSSPKLMINILTGIIMGIIAALAAVIFREKFDKKLTYSMLGSNVIYDFEKEFQKLQVKLFINKENQTAGIVFDSIPSDLEAKLKAAANFRLVNYTLTNDFMLKLENTDNVILFEKINSTDTEAYKQLKFFLKESGKNVLYEVLL